MLGLGLQINKMVSRAGGLPPLASLLTFFSKQRDDTTVINKLDSSGDSDAYLTVDPAVDIIDLSKYDIEDGTGDDLGWKVVKFNTINGEETYKVISTPTTYIENGNTYNGLNEVRNNLDSNYILSKDIDLNIAPYNTGDGWNTIGTLSNPFTGVFNGNGFKISNLFIDGATDYVGLFGNNDGGKISNIRIFNCNITSNRFIGAICGYNRAGVIINCSSTGTIKGSERIGGITSYNINYLTNIAKITNCYSMCNIDCSGLYSGGICSINQSADSIIDKCYYAGVMSGNRKRGISDVNNGIITDCYWDTETSGTTTSNGGTGLITAKMKTQSSFVGWDFDNVWRINPNINDGYPYLRMLEGEYVSPYGTLTKIVTVNIVETDANDPHSYVKMPDSIKIGGLDLFNRDDTTVYNTTCRSAEGYISEDPYLWHVDELNTETILSYLNNDYKFTWFVKNTFTEGTFDPLTIKEIFAYSQKITNANDLSKIMGYLGINVWYDSQDWIDALDWID